MRNDTVCIDMTSAKGATKQALAEYVQQSKKQIIGHL
jgi:hypothetical protein